MNSQKLFSQKWGNIVFAVVLLGAVGYMAWLAWGFETNPFADAFLPVKFFPLLLLGFVALSIVLFAIEYLTKGHSGDDKGEFVFEGWGGLVRTLLTVVFTFVAFWIWRQKGFDIPFPGSEEAFRVPAFAIAGILLPLATAFAMGARGWLQFLVIFVATLLVFVAFKYGLNIQFR